MKYTISIFDLDGTILNTLEDLADSTNYALKTCGYPERTMDEERCCRSAQGLCPLGEGLRVRC